MYKIVITLVIVTSTLFGGLKPNKKDYSSFDSIPTETLAKEMAYEMAKGVRLPMKLDEVTQLVNIYNFHTTIFFKKSIDIENKKIKPLWEKHQKELIQYMLKNDTQNICYNPVWQYMIFKRGIIPEFNYVSLNNKPLFRYTIEVEDCNKLKK